MKSNISNLKNKDRIKRKRKRKRKRKDKPKTYKEKLIKVRHRKRIRSKRMLTVDKMQTNKNNAEDDVKIGYNYFSKTTSL
jgi:hypothetical protein